MNRTVKMIFIFSMMIVGSLCIVVWAQAREKQDVVNSMQNRYPELVQAKNQGHVGEAWNGLVGIVHDNVPGNVREMVNAENNDRRDLFQIIAAETGTSVQEVALQNRIRMYRLADDNHFVQDPDRNWVRKRDLTL